MTVTKDVQKTAKKIMQEAAAEEKVVAPVKQESTKVKTGKVESLNRRIVRLARIPLHKYRSLRKR